jgi:hypothetical protein
LKKPQRSVLWNVRQNQCYTLSKQLEHFLECQTHGRHSGGIGWWQVGVHARQRADIQCELVDHCCVGWLALRNQLCTSQQYSLAHQRHNQSSESIGDAATRYLWRQFTLEPRSKAKQSQQDHESIVACRIGLVRVVQNAVRHFIASQRRSVVIDIEFRPNSRNKAFGINAAHFTIECQSASTHTNRLVPFRTETHRTHVQWQVGAHDGTSPTGATSTGQ